MYVIAELLILTFGFHRCSGCKTVRYCGSKCQRAGWTGGLHADECKVLKSVAPRTPPDTVRLLARIVLKLKAGGSRVAPDLPDGSQRSFGDLECHSKEVLNDEERMEAFNAYFEVLRQCFG